MQLSLLCHFPTFLFVLCRRSHTGWVRVSCHCNSFGTRAALLLLLAGAKRWLTLICGWETANWSPDEQWTPLAVENNDDNINNPQMILISKTGAWTEAEVPLSDYFCWWSRISGTEPELHSAICQAPVWMTLPDCYWCLSSSVIERLEEILLELTCQWGRTGRITVRLRPLHCIATVTLSTREAALWQTDKIFQAGLWDFLTIFHTHISKAVDSCGATSSSPAPELLTMDYIGRLQGPNMNLWDWTKVGLNELSKCYKSLLKQSIKNQLFV